ncbi:MAG: beta-propeller fold lactonase family protein, partial [Acidobacteria bacterium]|nr:beta-propeller fold lactonase family protein [Acidobacteriota bacterium]
DFGKLTYLETHSDSPSTDGLDGANSVAVSPDGAHVYVTGGVDDAVVVFSRNTGTGALTYVEFKEDDTGGINGLSGAAEVTVSPDGSLVFVAAPLNSAVAAFRRNSNSMDADFGKLTFVDWFTAPDYGEAGATATVDGLGETNSVSMSPDGLHLFSTGKTVAKDAAVVVMRISAGAACPDPASGTGDLSDQIAVPANSWVEFTAWYRIQNDATGTIHNEASFTIDQPADLVDGDSANNTDFDDTGVGLEVDIEITKVAGVATPVPGEALDYTITVTNHGPQNIDGSLGHITVSDIFPIYDGTTVMAGFDSPTNISWTCTAGTGGLCIDTSGIGNISAQVDLSAGGSVTFKADGIVHPWSTGNIDNNATFTLPIQYSDANSVNDQALDSRTVVPTADVGVVKGHLPPSDDFSVDPGDVFQYVIVVNNSGPSAVRGALIQDVFPGELENTTWTCSPAGAGSLCNNPTGVSNIASTVDLAPGGTATFTVTTQVRVTAEGAVVNTVTTDSGNATDPQNANNIDDDVITLNAKVDLAITKDDGRTEAVPGQSLTYTITVTNRGAEPYKDNVFKAQVQDIFPPELLDVSWTCDPTPPIPGALTFLQLNTLIGRLDGAADVAVSPDGAHVYAVGADGNTLSAYSRVTEQGDNFGKLSSAPIDEEQRDVSDPDPELWILADLEGPTAVIVSPDGRNLYVAASAGNAVLVFARDWASASDNFGTLSWVESLVDGAEGIDGLAGATDLVLSPDGEFLYVAGAADNAVAVFDRSATTGRLTYVETLIDGTGGIDGLAGVRSLRISPQGDHLYAAGANDDAVAWFSRASDTGQLVFEQAYISGAGGIDGLSGAASIILSPDGAQLYAAGPADNALVTFQRDSDSESPTFGALTFDVKLTSADAEGLSGVRALALPYDVNNPQDRGEHVLAAGDPSGKLVIFRRNVTTGILSFQDVLREGQPVTPATLTVHGLEVVSGIAFSPDGNHIYTTADGDDAIAVFDRRQPDPSFAYVEAEFDGRDDGYGRLVSGLSAARSVTVTGDGDHVLATAFGGDALVVFHRDPELGTTPDTRGKHLAFVEAYEDGGLDSVGQTIDGLDGAAQVVVSPDSSYVYVASEVDNAVAVFERNPATGEMTFVEMKKDGVGGVDGLSGAVALAVSPTGGGSSHIYVAGQYEASIAVFDRNAGNGALSYSERKINGVDGVEGLDGVSGIVVSPDRAHVYAVSRVDDALSVFTRDQADGTLTFLQVLRDGVAAEGLDQAMSVAISPDGAHVFVAAVNDDSLAVFSRDNDETSDSYGRLAFIQIIADGSTLADKTVDGLAGARSVAIDSNGLRVFVAGEHDGALSVFGRVADETSPDFGALNLIETRYDGVDGVDGLNQVYGVAVSLSDNSHVYVAGLGDNAVAAFEARSGSSCTPSGLGDINDEVNIGWGGQVAYTMQATVAPWATGTLTNEARVFAPPRTIDPDLIDNPIPQPGDNNYAVDQD